MRRQVMRMFAGAVAVIGLMPGMLRAEFSPVEQSGLSGGIVVGLDISDGDSIADLAGGGNFLVHG